MSTNNDLTFFLSWCIEQYKDEMKLDGETAFMQLDQYGVLEYLASNFEVLHTQGKQWLMEEIKDYIERKKKEEGV